MPLRTPAQYIESLRDDRVVYLNGKRIPDITEDPILGPYVRHAALDFEIAEKPENKDICLAKSEVTGNAISRYFHIPHTPEDLIARNRLIDFGQRNPKRLFHRCFGDSLQPMDEGGAVLLDIGFLASKRNETGHSQLRALSHSLFICIFPDAGECKCGLSFAILLRLNSNHVQPRPTGPLLQHTALEHESSAIRNKDLIADCRSQNPAQMVVLVPRYEDAFLIAMKTFNIEEKSVG